MIRHNNPKSRRFIIINFLENNNKLTYLNKVEKIEPFDWRQIIPIFKDEKLMEALIEKITDVNQPNELGINLIHYAVKYGTAKTLRVLIRCGADINRLDIFRIPPIVYAVIGGQMDIIDILMRADDDIVITDEILQKFYYL